MEGNENKNLDNFSEKNNVNEQNLIRDDSDRDEDVVEADNPSLVEKAIEVFETLPKDQKTILFRGMFAVQQFRGPLPPAKEFQGYKNVMPDAPERIISMAEKEQSHRMGLENKALKYDFWKTILGQIFGFVVSIIFGVGAVWLGMEGHTSSACVLGGATVVSLAAIFVINKLPHSDKLEG